MAGRLAGKVALITGGTSGIGETTVELFVKEGAKVVFTGRRSELGEEFKSKLTKDGYLVEFVLADHTKEEDCARAVSETLRLFQRVDILFNNAGIVTKGTAETTTEEDWNNTWQLNVTGVWRMCRLVIPVMRKQGSGSIVNNASDWGVVGARNALPYAVSKGAVVQMTKSMALDHAAEKIRVNAVCPGDTFVQRWTEKGYFEGEPNPVLKEEALAESASYIPMKRFAEAIEIAKAVLFLASDDSSFMTGHCMLVDGGNTAQ